MRNLPLLLACLLMAAPVLAERRMPSGTIAFNIEIGDRVRAHSIDLAKLDGSNPLAPKPYVDQAWADRTTQFQGWLAGGSQAVIGELGETNGMKWFALWIVPQAGGKTNRRAMRRDMVLLTDHVCTSHGANLNICMAAATWPGQRLVFQVNSPGTMYGLPLNFSPGTRARRMDLGTGYDGAFHEVQLSPKGNWAAIGVYHGTNVRGAGILRLHLFRMNRDATSVRLKPDGQPDRHCQVALPSSDWQKWHYWYAKWSRDGSYLALKARPEASAEPKDEVLLVLSATEIEKKCVGSGARALMATTKLDPQCAAATLPKPSSDLPMWTPGGKTKGPGHLYFADCQQGTQIHRYNPIENTRERITSDERAKYYPIPAPDDSYVAYVAATKGKRDLEIVQTGKGSSAALTTDLPPGANLVPSFGWKAD